LDKASEGVSKAAFSYGGQKCSACSRVYVQKDIKKEFIEKLISNIKKIKIDNPENKDSDLGPLINSSAFQNFKKYINIATEKGEIIYGGKIIDEGI
jgi:1-pyrroline-5-carboxylate dehydrogenase